LGSVAAVFAATEGELASIDGIGPEKAREIRRILALPARRSRTETV